jgi:hypothetical protein
MEVQPFWTEHGLIPKTGLRGASEPPAWAREVPKDILMIDASEEIGCALEVRGNAPKNRGWRRGASAIPAQKE